MGLVKGSPEAIAAGKKAALTKAQNRRNGIFITEKVVKPTKISESKFHEIITETPVRIRICKKMNYVYIDKYTTKLK